MVALALVENLQREDLSALEAAHSYHQLVHEFGLSHGEVAELVGKSRTTVANALRLLTLTESAQTALSEGRITEGHARALLAIGEQDRRDAVLREVVERGLSVREAESLANPAPLVRPRAKAAPTQEEATHPVMQNVLDNLQRALGTRVRLKPGSTMKRGVLEIEYYSAEDLDRVYEVVCD
jgi:ParB family chromosome partitioning protein